MTKSMADIKGKIKKEMKISTEKMIKEIKKDEILNKYYEGKKLSETAIGILYWNRGKILKNYKNKTTKTKMLFRIKSLTDLNIIGD